jgi:hypothetical protein
VPGVRGLRGAGMEMRIVRFRPSNETKMSHRANYE